MERYAAYRTKNLYVLIFSFRQKITGIESSPTPNLDWEHFCEDLLENYDEHFGITVARIPEKLSD